jgi:AcrR family transcriptional regulator
MAASASPDAVPARRRDAERSREQLLDAAAELFAERGFDNTTVRDLGARAGMDPALIARYFGSKTGLYLASLRRDNGGNPPADLLAPGRVRELLDRTSRRGTGPILQAVLHQGDDPLVHAETRETLHARLVDPLRTRLEAARTDRPQLRAEIAIATFAGVVHARQAGTLGALSTAEVDEVTELLEELLSGLLPG